MARWVLVVLALISVACLCAEAGLWSRSHGRRDHRVSRHRARQGAQRHQTDPRRPSVPEVEVVHRTREDAALQAQRLWNKWMNGTQSDQSQPQRSVFSLKQQLASRAGVDRLRKQGPERAFDGFDFMNDASTGYGVGDEGTRHFTELLEEIMVHHSCGEPVRQLVRVSDAYPSSRATYVPPSVLLRRCTDQTGCCTLDSATCAAAADVRVELPVLIIHHVGNKSKIIEYLRFVEHTKCHCVTKPRRPPASCSYNLPVNDASAPVEPKMAAKHGKRRGARPEKKTEKRTCRCTSEFASRSLPDGSCKCDCFVGNRKCKRQWRGTSSLSETNNRCIVTGNCDPPDCKYGAYKNNHGRCPRWRGEWRTQPIIV